MKAIFHLSPHRRLCRWLHLSALVTVCGTGFVCAAEPDLVVADFESGTYGDWKVEGRAFGTAPATGTLRDQKPVTGFIGHGFASSCWQGDQMEGKLTSPPFTVQRDYLQFLIGGGDRYPGKTCLNLLLDGKVIRTAIGKTGSETLKYQQWAVSEWKGKIVQLEIVDASASPRGHIMVDEIRQTDLSLVNVRYDVVLTNAYLQVPVKNGARKTAFAIFADGKLVRTFETELAQDGLPDWWATDDIKALRGKTVSVRCLDPMPGTETNRLTSLFQQTAVPVIGAPLYEETNRPQFHFTVQRGWNNDPNGLCYFHGQWHMFFQKIPYGLAVGDFYYMHWGHAVSPDLFHWTELPPAIYPLNGGIFSGGAYVDHGNKSGLGQGNADVVIASYTGDGENVVYGTGNLDHFQEILANPVLRHKGRDPQIIYYAPRKKWVMVVYEEAEQTGYAFYESKDLKSWHRMFCIEGGHECPNFFEMPVEGSSTRKWVLYGAERKLAPGNSSGGFFQRSSYMIGSFDGDKFTPETGFIKGLCGPNLYAAQTFCDAPDGRRILIAWLQTAIYPGMPFDQGMTVPMEMKLRPTPDGLRIFFNPVAEIEKLRTNTVAGADLSVTAANDLLARAPGDLLDVDLTVANASSENFTLWARGNAIAWDAATGELSCRNAKTKLTPVNGTIHLRVLVDRCVLELFPNDGVTGMTFGGAIEANRSPLTLQTDAHVRVSALRISELESAWKK